MIRRKLSFQDFDSNPPGTSNQYIEIIVTSILYIVLEKISFFFHSF